MRYKLINAGGIVVLFGQDLVQQNEKQTPEKLSLCLSDPPTENACQSPSPNSRQRQRHTCAADTADARVQMTHVNVCMEDTRVTSTGSSAPKTADRWQ